MAAVSGERGPANGSAHSVSAGDARASGEPAGDDGAAEGPIASADFGANEWLVDEMHQRYLADPSSVDPAWWNFFADYQRGTGSSQAGQDGQAAAGAPVQAAPGQGEPGRAAPAQAAPAPAPQTQGAP